jgi:hypothetical protein
MVPDQLEYSVMKHFVVYHTILILIPYFILEDILIITENNMAVAARMLRLRLSSVNPCLKKRGRKGFSLAVNLATQINTIKNWNYPEFNKIGIFWLFFRGDVHF